MIERVDVIAETRHWLGVPWRHQGRTEHGLDCVGLVVVVCRGLGISDYDLAAYPREPKGAQFLSHFLAGGGTRVAIDAALPGDLMLFREGRYPCHTSILSERDGSITIIHAHATRRKVVEEPMAHDWPLKRVAAIRLPGIA